MELTSVLRQVTKVIPRGVGEVKCFERELARAGGVAFRVDLGVRTIPTAQIVGSVGRWNCLRGDFLYKHAPTLSARHQSVGRAMRQGKALPAIEVYELRTSHPTTAGKAPRDEYYVVDGHHRVAMAKKLGVDFLDAHVVLYRASPVLSA